VNGKVNVGIVCLPTVTVKEFNGPGSEKRFQQTVRLLFANKTEIEPQPPLATGEAGTVAHPLLFVFPVSDQEIDISQNPDGNVKSLRLRVNGVELPTIVRSGNSLQFGTIVRVLK
jgi:hypothetical protein